MRAAISFQRAMLNLVWDEVQDESSRNSQPHIGSDGAGTTHFTPPRQELGRFFCLKCLGLRPRTSTWKPWTADCCTCEAPNGVLTFRRGVRNT